MLASPQLDGPLRTEINRAPFFRRIWVLLTVFLALLLLALLPPYLNVNRFQRRITTSISASLGRPVHLDNVTLNLLPIPSFTLDNFVVSEDPVFGYEPTIRANTVTARLRVSTLWRRRIEFSRITFTDPSVNLVHTADGKWNLDSILLQASHLNTAPTAQPQIGPAPRFPYIEATGARLNLKLDNVKTPFALTEADFALWLPSPETWHFRISARPARTDVPVGYSGVLHLEGTLGRAPTLSQIPIDLSGEWRTAPLGEVSRILLGRDAGWRGEMTLGGALVGTVGSNTIHAALRMADLHRSNFVPAHPLSIAAECDATVTGAFTSLPALRCGMPSSTGKPALNLSGSADLRSFTATTLHATLSPIPTAILVPVLATFSARIPPRLVLGGTLSGDLDCDTAPCDVSHLNASLDLEDGSILADPDDKNPIAIGDVTLHSAGTPAAPRGSSRKGTATHSPPQANPADALVFPTTTIALGGHEPAMVDGRIDKSGLTLHLSGSATPERLRAIAAALPQFADGFPEQSSQTRPTDSTPARLDLTATRNWAGSQTWQETLQKPRPPSRTPGRRRRQP